MSRMRNRGAWEGLLALAVLLMAVYPVRADDWEIHITVDNQYDVYFGDGMGTNTFAGGDTNWQTTETWTANGQPANAFLYVSTASDHAVAQGFLAEFINTTQNAVITTGSGIWEVFPAGRYLQQIDPTWPATWPPSVMPTQAEVDAAIAYATTNNLWTTPTTLPGYNNSAGPGPWGTRLGFSYDPSWIWFDSGNDPSPNAPFNGFNHDEFLIFRVPNIPEPATAGGLLGLGLLALRRRR